MVTQREQGRRSAGESAEGKRVGKGYSESQCDGEDKEMRSLRTIIEIRIYMYQEKRVMKNMNELWIRISKSIEW